MACMLSLKFVIFEQKCTYLIIALQSCVVTDTELGLNRDVSNTEHTRESGPGPQTLRLLLIDIQMTIIASGKSESAPRGGVSVLGTKTIPFRTSARFTRLRARETHWPASAEVTVTLMQTEGEMLTQLNNTGLTVSSVYFWQR